MRIWTPLSQALPAKTHQVAIQGTAAIALTQEQLELADPFNVRPVVPCRELQRAASKVVGAGDSL